MLFEEALLLERRLRALGLKVREGALAPMRPLAFAPAAPLLTRSFEDAEVYAKGRRVELMCAPFNTPARVLDPPPSGDGKPYYEELLPGCFREATLDPLAVELDISHGERTIGHAERLEEKPDGLVGAFTLTGSRREVDRTTSLIRSGHLGGASVAFSSIESRRSPARGGAARPGRLEPGCSLPRRRLRGGEGARDALGGLMATAYR
jgi:hypothetical protein